MYIVWQGDGSRYSRVACPLAVTHTVYRDRSTRVVYSVHVCMMNLYSTMVRSVCSTPGFKTLPTHGPKQQPIVLVPRIHLKLVIGTIINLTSYVGQHVYSFVFLRKHPYIDSRNFLWSCIISCLGYVWYSSIWFWFSMGSDSLREVIMWQKVISFYSPA